MEENKLFSVKVLGVVFDPKEKKILIGRRENDEHVPELTWSFPGGTLRKSEKIEEFLKEDVKKKTGLEIESLGPIFARILPENEKFMMVYFLCENVGGTEEAGEKFVELKWVAPEELEKNFTTSFDPKLKEYIENLK